MTNEEYEATFQEYLENVALVKGNEFSNLVYVYYDLLAVMSFLETKQSESLFDNVNNRFMAAHYYDELLYAISSSLGFDADESKEAYDMACQMRSSLLGM